jgi:hypothetical protein
LKSQDDIRDKYCINPDAKKMIEMIDKILAKRKEEQTQNLMKMLLKSKAGGVKNFKSMLHIEDES